MQVLSRALRWVGLASIAVIVVVALNLQVTGAAPTADTRTPTTQESIAPDKGPSPKAPKALTSAERAGLKQKLLDRRAAAMTGAEAAVTGSLPAAARPVAGASDPSPAASFAGA